MGTIDKDVQELQRRLGEGAIQRAYQAIVSYMSHLRAVFTTQQGERLVSGLYQGYFDMTYFALFPDVLKKRDLKLAIVFTIPFASKSGLQRVIVGCSDVIMSFFVIPTMTSIGSSSLPSVLMLSWKLCWPQSSPLKIKSTSPVALLKVLGALNVTWWNF